MSTLPPNVTEIVPGRIFAVTGYLTADARISWIPPELTGFLGVSCYLIRDGAQALLIDTGLAIHRQEITQGLEAVLEGVTSRAMIMTRREPDSIINLPWLIKRLGLNPVYCGGALNPLDFFERLDEANVEGHLHGIAQTKVTWVAPGGVISIGDMVAEVLRTRLCVLPKTHVFERTTRTLFASDSWGALTQKEPGKLAVLRQPDERLTRNALERYISHKFDWLLGIDTSSVADDIAALTQLSPLRICSASGCVIEGEQLVRDTLLETAAAIRQLEHVPLKNRLGGWTESDLRQAVAMI